MSVPTHLTLLGYSPVFIPLLAWAKAKGIGVTILTAPDQASELEAIGIRTYEALDKLDADAASRWPEAFQPGTFALSCGARWIFRKPQLQALFNNRLLNAHGTRLPFDRGGGGFSWRIMRGDRIGCITLHLITEGVDTGPLVASEDYVIPRGLRTPAEMFADYEKRLADFLLSFLEKGAPVNASQEQNLTMGTYYPRLQTVLHSWVDWSWTADDIERFIMAFDQPYPGARTCWRGKTVILRNVQLHHGEIPHHPFQTGLVIRNNGRWLTIALSGPACLLVEDARDEDGGSLLTSIREGDRLFTPSEKLEAALQQRVSVGPGGAKVLG